jgi:hypothetical protein
MAGLNIEDKSQLTINSNTECDDKKKPRVTAYPHGELKWKRLANEYNEQLKGVNQLAHEPYIYVGRDKSVQGQHRSAPWRDCVDIKDVATRWKEYKKMITLPATAKRGIKAATELGHRMDGSFDQEEILNPKTILNPRVGSESRHIPSLNQNSRQKMRDDNRQHQRLLLPSSKRRAQARARARESKQ